MAQCTGTTKTGNRCKQKATDGGDVDRCPRHPRRTDLPVGNLDAFNEWLTGLDTDGASNGALVQAGRSLAKAVDDNPAHANLWRQYVEVLRLLMEDERIDDDAQNVLDDFDEGGNS